MILLWEIIKTCLIGGIFTFIAGLIGFSILYNLTPSEPKRKCLLSIYIAFGFLILMFIYNILLITCTITLINVFILTTLLFILFHKKCNLFIKIIYLRLEDLFLAIKEDKLILIPIFIIILTTIVSFIGLLAPSTGYDSNVYHLTLPKIYANAEGFVNRPDILQSKYPQVLLGIHTIAYQWGGENAIEILNLIPSLLLLLAIFELSTFLKIKKKLLILSPIIILGSLQFMLCLYDADIEGWLAYFYICLFYSYFLMKNFSNSHFLILIGAFGGILLGIKVTTLPGVSIIFLMAFIWQYNYEKKVFSKKLIQATCFALFYGLFLYLFMHLKFPELYSENFIEKGAPLFFLRRLYFHNLYSSCKVIFLFNFPLLIYLLIFPKSLKTRDGKEILIISSCILLGILITNPYVNAFARYTYYATPIYVLGILMTVDRLDGSRSMFYGILQKVLIVILIISVLLCQILNCYRNFRKLPVVLGIENKDTYLAKRINTYKTISKANSLLSNNDKLLLVAERSYWLNIPYYLGIYRNPTVDYSKMTPNLFLSFLEKHTISHLLYTDEGAEKTIEFLNFWDKYPELQNNPRFKLIYHDTWKKGKIVRNSYLYKIIPHIIKKTKDNHHAKKN
jgi:hypothetical protein